MNKYTRQNLIKIDSYVEAYEKFGDEFIEDFDISEISLNDLKNIFESRPNDDVLSLSYEVDESKASLINSFLNTQIVFDFNKCEYFLQRYGIYKD